MSGSSPSVTSVNGATQKKQQSISSFFSRKAPSDSRLSTKLSDTAVLPQPSTISSRPNDSSNVKASRPVSDDDDQDVPIKPSRSNSKRLRDSGIGSPGESTQHDPPSKRQRLLSRPSQEIVTEQHSLSPNPSPILPGNRHTDNLVTDRTSKFLFSSSSNLSGLDRADDEIPKERQRLRQQFVKKLGRPDLRWKDLSAGNIVQEGDDNQGDENIDEEDDLQARLSTRGKKAPANKKGNKLTPMERQVIDIKRTHTDTLLVVEVGYKFRFFGEDARIAAKELSIVCIPGKFRFDEHPSEGHLDRFASASIPTHRLHVHVKRLVSAGHKVGVVRQLETAALKAAGDNRNAPFVRQLTNLYTKGTYVDDIEGLESDSGEPSHGTPAKGHLLCITETSAKGWGNDEKVQIGIVAVQPATGDIIYDDFEDGFMRSEIETRLLHIAPCEFLIVGSLSRSSEKLIEHLSESKTNVFGDKARVEHVEKSKTAAATSYSHISSFYSGMLRSTDGMDGSVKGKILDKTHQLSEHVSICLSAMIRHLTEYGLEHVFDLTKNFQPFSARSHMLLNGTSLTSLEVYRNQTDNSEKGSLFWVLDQTQTRFGQRLLRKWVGRPLLDKKRLQERIDAVDELKTGERSLSVDKLKTLLSKTKSDLEKSLIRIYYKKCTRPELLSVLQALQRIGTEYAHVKTASDSGFTSDLLCTAISSLPQILHDVLSYLDRINPHAAKGDDKYSFFREEHQTEDITEHQIGITSVEEELNNHLGDAAEKLRRKRVEYVTVAGIDFLIEVENNLVKNVPASWVKISGTKKVSRFHTPEVIRLIRKRDRHRESLAAACDGAFTSLLSEISSRYQSFRDCIQSLATLDCLVSLAEVASRPDYCKPTFADDTRISVEGGRHPMVEQLLLDTYVPNDISLSADEIRGLLITGPNMGGKSSYVRQVALISIMGQIGSYVPAQSARLGMLDAIYTRMGAFDNMLAGESTFMVELSETADILKQATPRSLIILDELGRGTSTHDGVAIAHAVLDHIVKETRSLLLFITHYQSLSSVADSSEDAQLRNVHMKFTETQADDETEDADITFLYELGEGVAHRSYGLNVARLANLPRDVIDIASVKSKEMETDMQMAKLGSLGRAVGKIVGPECVTEDIEGLVNSLEQL